ncbi:MAG: plasmid pRiA4b ORF-3 family protein [Deltaproteobacteria bacterium]|nr:plasmid pRiA4b ORF-3 family protein [Deltaproteobacteria bacterium]MBF0524052.1 plasmid pRiA4b ORF-3 family protein [Deltaproteobacteria bacterium]
MPLQKDKRIKKVSSSKKSSEAKYVYHVRITLRGVRPPIWRKVLVTNDISLVQFHRIIQLVMGWSGHHLYQFIIDGNYYSEPFDDDDDDDLDDLAAGPETEKRASVLLHQVASEEKARLIYEYDFGDNWEHLIVIQNILPIEEGKHYPVCTDGKRSCPPEDIGGAWGYGQFLEAIRDPNHPQHKRMTDRVGKNYDPEAFDLDEANRILKEKKNFIING